MNIVHLFSQILQIYFKVATKKRLWLKLLAFLNSLSVVKMEASS